MVYQAFEQAGLWGSIMPAVWSFMLAARVRGLGTCWTSVHLFYEQEAAAVLGIPYEQVTQAALIPVAYTLGTDFKAAARKPLESVLHWDRWLARGSKSIPVLRSASLWWPFQVQETKKRFESAWRIFFKSAIRHLFQFYHNR